MGESLEFRWAGRYTKTHKIALALIDKAAKGDVIAIKEVIDRSDGTPKRAAPQPQTTETEQEKISRI